MLLTEITILPVKVKDETNKVQPVKRIAKVEPTQDSKKKPVPKGRIDTYA